MLYSGERELVEPTSSGKTEYQVREWVAIPQSKTLTHNCSCLKELQGWEWCGTRRKEGPVISRAFVPASKNTLRTIGIFCGKAFITYLSGGKTQNRENGAAYIARSVTFQHLMWRDSS
jgi:hypothetical protein